MHKFLVSLIFALGLAHAALADESLLGCIATGSSTVKNECADLIPQPWAYNACDPYRTAAAQADWCFAFGGTGDAQHCSVSATFTDENIPPVSENFMQIVHGCTPPSELDSGWGVNVDDGSGGNTCWVDGPGYTSGILTKDFKQLTFSGQDGSTCTHNYTDHIWARRDRLLTCPAGYYHYVDGSVNLCIRSINCACPKLGNPTRVSDGQKVIWETDYPAIAGGLLEYRRVYRSYGHFNPSELLLNVPFDGYWESNFDSRLYVLPSPQYPVPYVVSAPDGTVHYFDTTGKEVIHYGSAAETLAIQYNGGGTLIGYVRTLSDETRQTFSPSGLLVAVDDTKSHHLSLAYNASGNLQTVTDEHGRSLTFGYNVQNQRASVTFSDGQSISYAYDTNANLQTVTFPGGAARVYRYENQSYIHALTGTTDENNANYASYTYDTNGRVQDVVHAPSLASGTIDHYHFAYVADTNIPSALVSTTVTEPLGQSVTYNFQKVAGINSLSSLSGPCGGCEEKNKSINYDTYGYLQSTTDFNNVTSTYVYDDLRGLPTQRVEASSKPEQRTTATIWDPTFRFPNQRTVANGTGSVESRENWAYNSLGQVSARCLVDVAVSGASSYVCGSSTNAPAGVRQWTYTYCTLTGKSCPLVGLLVSVNGPRTDVTDVTSYAYYPTTVISGCGSLGGICHNQGDLQQVTNALGQITSYVSYDKNGHISRLQDSNGVYSDMTYNQRGWLLTRTLRANTNGTPNATLDATTTFAYDNIGNVTQVTQPDATYLHYVYDDAHRLTDIYDSAVPANYLQGSRIHYALDAAGNRLSEVTSDPSGSAKRNLTRQYTSLNHLLAMLNSSAVAVQSFSNPTGETPPTGVTYTDGYDGNGNPIYSTDANGVGTEQQYDGLKRLVKTLQDHTGSGATHNTTTQYAYDMRDNLRSVIDPDNLTTGYTYDGLNNLSALSSPDTGSTGYTYDAAGNRTTQTDARGIVSTYSYDALNRLSGISYPTSSLNTTFTYDTAATGCYNVARLAKIVDSSGSTTYCYDQRGNVTKKIQVTNAVALTTLYSYTLADRLSTVTYPSGAIATYGRDTVGRVTSLTYKANATATAINVLTGVTYYPYGPQNVFTFGNGRTLTKTYDHDYAIDQVTSSNSAGLIVDATVDAMGSLTNASSAIGATPPTQQYQYDPLQRLTNVQNGSGTSLMSFTYNLTGDRLSKTVSGSTTPYTYSSPFINHRLLSENSNSRAYDSNGNMISGPIKNAGITFPGVTFTFDDRNRFSGASFIGNTLVNSYNGKGERVRKNSHIGSTTVDNLYTYDESGRLIGEYSNSGGAPAEYIYLGSIPVAFTKGGTLYYVETDQLGTPRQVILPGATTAADTTVWKWDYFASNSAFGENAPSVQTVTFNLRFPGQYFDAETGLNYNYFRDYEAGTGRYVESDLVGLIGGPSTYSYVRNRPLNNIDKNGLMSSGDICMAFFGSGNCGAMLPPPPSPDPFPLPAPAPPKPAFTCNGYWVPLNPIMYPGALESFACACRWQCRSCDGNDFISGNPDDPYAPTTIGQPVGLGGDSYVKGSKGGGLKPEPSPAGCMCEPPTPSKKCPSCG